VEPITTMTLLEVLDPMAPADGARSTFFLAADRRGEIDKRWRHAWADRPPSSHSEKFARRR
jgi:hypothetical protein